MSHEEQICWLLMFACAAASLWYGPSGYKEHYAHVRADSKAVFCVLFTLLSLGFAVRILSYG